jgi:hypothetical protein
MQVYGYRLMLIPIDLDIPLTANNLHFNPSDVRF